MAETHDSEPVEQMPRVDLAQAIVALARSAERRRGARAHLFESTDTVARAVRQHLRTGDRITLPSTGASKKATTYSAGRVSAVSTTAKASSTKPPEGDVLLRNDAILGLPGARGPYYNHDLATCHSATLEERQEFAAEIESVIHAFSELMKKDTSYYESIANKAAKLTPR